jgi:hypothetical protein
MLRLKIVLIAGPVAACLLAAPAAQAGFHGGGGFHGGPGFHGTPGFHGGPGFRPGFGRDFHHGPFVGGVFLGLGAAALAGGVIASQACYAPWPYCYVPPPVYYAPPPGYYPPPPGYYPPPPGQ